MLPKRQGRTGARGLDSADRAQQGPYKNYRGKAGTKKVDWRDRDQGLESIANFKYRILIGSRLGLYLRPLFSLSVSKCALIGQFFLPCGPLKFKAVLLAKYFVIYRQVFLTLLLRQSFNLAFTSEIAY